MDLSLDSSLPPPSELRGKKVALFGLSANPPTLAHRRIVDHLASRGLFDEVWILPVYKHIFDAKSDLESYDHRIRMLELGVAGQFETNATRVRVSRLEKVVGDIFRSHADPKKQSERVGTVDILEHIHAVYTGVIFSLVLGTDTFYDLIGGKWKRWESILQMVELHVFSRSKPSDLKIMNYPSTARGVTMHQITGLLNISSTSVRNRPPPIRFGSIESLFFESSYLNAFPTGLHSHKTVDSELHSDVLVYIEEKQLYFMSAQKLVQRRRWFYCMLVNAALLMYDLRGEK